LASEEGWKAGDRRGEEETLIGPSLEIREGHAADEEIRFRASSGGILSALSIYCLEKGGMRFVLHTGMDPERPWRNTTVVSRTREDVLSHAGSRYAPSSPCDSLRRIEDSDGPCVFIGKPCDAAAVMALRKERPRLDRNLGLVLTFFCAGTPCSQATIDLVKTMRIDPSEAEEIRFRGNGWPGTFSVRGGGTSGSKDMEYADSWGYLARQHRSFRCHLCPDGLGEIADISSGDAWHRYAADGNPGESIVLVRTGCGREILRKAAAAGYLDLWPSTAEKVVAAQGLVVRRSEVFGRMLAMRLFFVPVPDFRGFHLFGSWIRSTPWDMARTVLGTARRILTRGLWRRNPVPAGGDAVGGSVRSATP
jgi:coenzyme F420 hydrogenase subunit beta